MSGPKPPTEDAQKQERLIVEVATAAKLQELGISAKLSPESLKMTDYWTRELKENPCLVDILEKEVNNALAMVHKAERGEKVELSQGNMQGQMTGMRNLLPKHYYVADEIKTLPNKDTKEVVVVKDPEAKKADVVLPAGASTRVDNEIPGMNKGRISHALQKEGYENISFYNVDGAMGYRPDDRYFDGKEVSVARLSQWKLETIAVLDVSDAVRRSGSVDFDKVLMLRDDQKKWALYIKPENEKAFSVYPEKSDVNKFFATVNTGDVENTDKMRQDMALKYYMAAMDKPDLKVDLFKSDSTQEELSRIDHVTIFKTKETESKPSAILCLPVVDGEKQRPREVSPSQWQRLWLADDMLDYKKHIAASLFADVLRKDRTNAVAVGTDKSEQEAQTQPSTQQAQQQDKAEEKTVQQDSQNTAVQKASGKSKDEKATLSPELKLFYDLKAKHPDAILLFRTGDFYQSYCQDAERTSKLLGVTLTHSNRTKDKEGKPLAMAAFPYHALDTYLPKLIRAGERVAICDQLEPQRHSRGASEENKEPVPVETVSRGPGVHR